MKRALYFAVIYLSALILGTLIFATLFMFSNNLNMFVTGLPSSFFSLHHFMNGIFLSIPLACIVIQILLILYVIRHPRNQLVSMLMYIIFSMLSWLLIIPADLKLINLYESDLEHSRTESTSAGIFRKEGNGIYYFSRVNDDKSVDGLFLDTTGFLGQEGAAIPLFNAKVSNESAFPYSDIIIKNSLQPSQLVTYPLSVYHALLTVAIHNVSEGFFPWISFAAIGLALMSLYALQFASSWKLANVTCTVFCAMGILFLNYLYYMNIFPSILIELGSKLSSLTGAKDPMIHLVNIIIFLLMLGFGIFMAIYRNNQENKE